MWPWPPAEACSLILKGRHVALHPLSFLSQSPKLPPPAWPVCVASLGLPFPLFLPPFFTPSMKLRSAQPSAPGEDALHLRDEVITGGKTRGCRSPGFQLPWKHVRPMEGWELSAVEGGGGIGERVAERHISWRVLLTAPGFPKGCALQLAGPLGDHRWTGAEAGSGLGGGHRAQPRVCTHQALAGGLSVCSGCEVTLLWMCPGAA